MLTHPRAATVTVRGSLRPVIKEQHVALSVLWQWRQLLTVTDLGLREKSRGERPGEAAGSSAKVPLTGQAAESARSQSSAEKLGLGWEGARQSPEQTWGSTACVLDDARRAAQLRFVSGPPSTK